MSDDLTQALLAKAIERARQDFTAFVYLMAPLVLPEGFISGRHIDIICREVGRCATEKNLRLMVEVPPGACKSTIVSVLLPAFLFGCRPTMQFLQLSHGDDLASKFGRKLRDLLDSREYQLVFPGTRLKDTSYSASRWDTTAGGGYYAAGSNKQIAGYRFDVLSADDVLSEQTARSEVERQAVIDNWHGGVMSRQLPGSSVIVTNTRWAVMDLSGFLIKQENEIPTADKWQRLRFTALADEETSRLLGVPEGTSYWPEFYSTSFFEQKRDVSPARDWAALYMQNPIIEGGNIIKAHWVLDWKEKKPPPVQYCLISVDPAYSTKSTADFTAVTIWGLFQKEWKDSLGRPQFVNQMILLGGKRERMEFPDLCNYLKDLNRRRKPDTILIEKKASGESIIQELRRQGVPITAWVPDKDKISRVWSVAPVFEANRVWMKRDLVISKLCLEELEAFPNAQHDDLVDSVVQAVMFMRRSRLEIVDPSEDLAPKRRIVSSYWNSINKKRAF